MFDSLMTSHEREQSTTLQRPYFGTSEVDQNSLAAKLTLFRLTINEARVYLFLLRAGPANVRTISKQLGLHRVEVYRKLKELEEAGIIDVVISSPKSYVSLEPKIALTNLFSRVEQESVRLKKTLPTLERQLTTYQSFEKNQRSTSAQTERYYRMAHGMDRYYGMVASLVRNASSEVLTVVSPRGVKEIFQRGLNKNYQAAEKRGVSLRIISEVNDDNIDYVKRLQKFAKFRKMSAIHLRFVVSDRSVALLRWRLDRKYAQTDHVTNDDFLIFEDTKFCESLSMFFEDLWQTASEHLYSRK